MARHEIIIDGRRILARSGERLLDVALNNGIDLPHDCRAGHCGTCRVQLISGVVDGGEGAEPGIVHACQCRIIGNVVVEPVRQSQPRTVEGVVTSLRLLSAEVIEVGIKTERALPYLAGQYAQVQFNGFPSRAFSFTHPLSGDVDRHATCFHVRRMKGGRVTSALGRRIRPGHRVTLTGPFGAAHFRANQHGRMVLVATNTGFAPIWSIAVAALRENPHRRMMVIAGGRNRDALYMGAALGQLSRFPNVLVVPVCSGPHAAGGGIKAGWPTDHLPQLLASDVIYACGAPAMVEAIRAIAGRVGAVCHADPFVASREEERKESAIERAAKRLSTRIGSLTRPSRQLGPERALHAHRADLARARNHYPS